MGTKPRILELDLETAPGQAYIWSMWDKFIPLERLISPGRILCAAYKWYGERDIGFVSEWEDGRETMLEHLAFLLTEADAVITYNGDKFDLPRLYGELAEAGIDLPGPVTSIDLYKTVKKFGYMSGKLAYVAPFLKIGEKTKHAGFELWKEVLDGYEDAQKKMETYNKQDVRLLDRLYKRLLPYITNHPYLKDTKSRSCPNCSSSSVEKRGFRRTRTFKVEKLHCTACGSWSSGTKTKVQ
jgi:hypothetical protein